MTNEERNAVIQECQNRLVGWAACDCDGEGESSEHHKDFCQVYHSTDFAECLERLKTPPAADEVTK